MSEADLTDKPTLPQADRVFPKDVVELMLAADTGQMSTLR